MAATDRSTWLRRLAGLLGSLLATGGAKAVDLPEDRGEAMYHLYTGGGVTAHGPALLVRKSLADRVSLSASYYVDAVSNASIDVVTTASKYKETRNAYDLGVDYVVRDSTISLSTYQSKEPDYDANAISMDVSQEVFGNMTTVALGYTRGSDKVGQKGVGYFDTARHWQYRLGVTQILSPTWLASVNLEAVADDGYLGNPYRAARVFGATVPERHPRTRSSRAVKLRSLKDIGERQSVRVEYRYFWDTWAVKAHTVEGGYSRYFGDAWLADGFLRYYSQSKANFYSDNAQSETLYVSRNRQLGTFNSIGLGAKLTYSAGRYQGKYDIKVNGSLEAYQFRYRDFTDLRDGSPYSFIGTIFQVVMTATY